MYYSHSCSYCTKTFYTFHDSKESASQILFEGIKKHLVEYGEDHKEYMFDEDVTIEINQMYYAMSESDEEPAGGYKL